MLRSKTLELIEELEQTAILGKSKKEPLKKKLNG
jgi:Txe/YoeB family toxin of Txe-Axe toxin-antitoxin module